MSIRYPPDAQAYYLDGLLKFEREVMEKSLGRDILYRGEPEHHNEEPFFGKVSSTLYRINPDGFDSEQFDLSEIQKDNLQEVRNYTHEHQKTDFEILTELQHYGNPTNLIDFTTDYNIALYFACDGSHDKDGRVILLRRTKETDERYHIEKPQGPQNRVIAQKSIFAQPANGYIDFEDVSVISVPSNLKQWILIHLHRFQDICTQSIYNDIHGYIRHRTQPTLNEAVPYHARANRAKELAVAKSRADEERNSLLQQAINSYIKAIQYAPYDAKTYVDQGQCYVEMHEHDLAMEAFCKAVFLRPDYAPAYCCRAILYLDKGDYENVMENFNKAIELDPDGVNQIYYSRGTVWLMLSEWNKAKSDFLVAQEKGKDISSTFCKDYISVKDFQQRFRVQLPPDIVMMLQPR